MTSLLFRLHKSQQTYLNLNALYTFAFVPSKKDRSCLSFRSFYFHVTHLTYQIWSRLPKVMAASNRRNTTKNQPQNTKGAQDMTDRSHP